MKAFFLLLAGQTVALLGGGLTRFALGVWVYQTTGSVTRFSLITFLGVTPAVLLAPLLGSLIDRYDRRRVMALGNAGARLGSLALFFLAGRGDLTLGQIAGAVLVSATFGALQFPALAAATTQLVAVERRSRANGMVQLGSSLAALLAPLLGGALVQALTVRGILLVDVAAGLFALLALLGVRIPRPEPAAGEGAGRRSLLADSALGWRFLSARADLLTLLLLFAGINFVMTLVEILYTPLVLGFAPSAVLGGVLTGAGCGLLAGGIVMSTWGGPQRRVQAIVGAVAVQGIMLAVGGLRPNAFLIGGAAFVYLACLPVVSACSQTIWQSQVPADLQGRVFALRQMVATAALPLATLLAGPLADRVFEPLLKPRGALAASLGPWLGTGPGRGVGLLLILLGGAVLTLALWARGSVALRHLDSERR